VFPSLYACFADWGEKENSDVAARFNIKNDDFPEYRLFLQGKTDPVAYTGDEAKADDIKKFVVKESGMFMHRVKCFDLKFMLAIYTGHFENSLAA
jgi:endoplasmic reticulum protein 29